MKILAIPQGPAHGDERADDLAQRDGVEVRIVCFSAPSAARSGASRSAHGYDHFDRMIASATGQGAEAGPVQDVSGRRGIIDAMVIDDAHRSALDEVTHCALLADTIITV